MEETILLYVPQTSSPSASLKCKSLPFLQDQFPSGWQDFVFHVRRPRNGSPETGTAIPKQTWRRGEVAEIVGLRTHRNIGDHRRPRHHTSEPMAFEAKYFESKGVHYTNPARARMFFEKQVES